MYESTKSDPVGMVTGRRAILDEYFHQFGDTAIGLAETRTKSRKLCPSNYVVVSSGPQKNSLGCEIWLAKSFPVRIGTGEVKMAKVSPKLVSKVFASPRILLVSVLINSHVCNFLAYHAPHEQWSIDVRKVFFSR